MTRYESCVLWRQSHDQAGFGLFERSPSWSQSIAAWRLDLAPTHLTKVATLPPDQQADCFFKCITSTTFLWEILSAGAHKSIFKYTSSSRTDASQILWLFEGAVCFLRPILLPPARLHFTREKRFISNAPFRQSHDQVWIMLSGERVRACVCVCGLFNKRTRYRPVLQER